MCRHYGATRSNQKSRSPGDKGWAFCLIKETTLFWVSVFLTNCTRGQPHYHQSPLAFICMGDFISDVWIHTYVWPLWLVGNQSSGPQESKTWKTTNKSYKFRKADSRSVLKTLAWRIVSSTLALALVSLTRHFLFSESEHSNSLSFSLDKTADEDDAYDFNTDYV